MSSSSLLFPHSMPSTPLIPPINLFTFDPRRNCMTVQTTSTNRQTGCSLIVVRREKNAEVEGTAPSLRASNRSMFRRRRHIVVVFVVVNSSVVATFVVVVDPIHSFPLPPENPHRRSREWVGDGTRGRRRRDGLREAKWLKVCDDGDDFRMMNTFCGEGR